VRLEGIRLVLEPPTPVHLPSAPTFDDYASPRQFYRYDDFAAQLRLHTDAPVAVQEVYAANTSGHDLLLVHPAGHLGGYEQMLAEWGDRRGDLSGRVILLQVDRANPGQLLERLRVAGAIDARRYLEAMDQPDWLGAGLIGRRAIAARAGFPSAGSIFDTEHYCDLLGENASLPVLEIRYFDALREANT
jgi:hypothetical protein